MDYIDKINKVIEYIINTANFKSEKEKSVVTSKLKDLFMGRCLIEYAQLIKGKHKKISHKQVTNREDFINLLKEIKSIIGDSDYITVLIEQSKVLVDELARLVGKNCSKEYIKEYNEFVKKTFNVN